MAMDLLPDFPAVSRATLLDLARLQGVTHNLRGEEEPGRILHEFRAPDDPHAIRLSAAGWDFPYYGAVDTTPQWVNLLGAHCARLGYDLLDEHLTDRQWRSITVRDSLLAALGWMVGRLDDPIGGGYLWVRRAGTHGIPNQVWEDSFDSHYHADGSLFDVTRPYAPVAQPALARADDEEVIFASAWPVAEPEAVRSPDSPDLTDAEGEIVFAAAWPVHEVQPVQPPLAAQPEEIDTLWAEFDEGVSRILATGTPDEIRNNSAVIEAYLGTEHAGAAA